MMHSTLLIILLVLWGIVALCLIGLLVYRGVVGRNEEIELMVDQAEHRFVEEQRAISASSNAWTRPSATSASSPACCCW